MPGSAPWEESKPGIVAVVLPDGGRSHLADDVWVSERDSRTRRSTPVVAESRGNRLTAWTITDSARWSTGAFGPTSDRGSRRHLRERRGAIWYASVPGQRCTLVAEVGTVLDTVEANRGCFACMLGGDDGATLYDVVHRGQPIQPRRRFGRHRIDPPS
jgi:hypothetical protein